MVKFTPEPRVWDTEKAPEPSQVREPFRIETNPNGRVRISKTHPARQ